MSQFDLAVKVATRPETIGRYERGKMQPGADVVVRIADALGVSGGWLLGDETTSEPVHDEELPDIDKALLPFRAKLTPEIEAHIRRRHMEGAAFLDGGRMATLVGFVEDEIAKWHQQQSGMPPKTKEAPATVVELPADAPLVPGKKRGR